jgi:hypothetical protein
VPLIFSHGSLQQPDVQVSIYGRALDGVKVTLASGRQAWVYVSAATVSTIER